MVSALHAYLHCAPAVLQQQTPFAFAPARRLNVYHNGMSGGERLVPPSEYTRLPGMGMRPGDRTYSRFNTYTFNWQPSHVSWGMNGVPLLTRTTGEHVRWRDMHGKLMK